ncbi:unnamed protein product [Rotaria sordida]|uniref:Uncharacterized protein n=2 Tax=Rotaria sordida TaxID=392033 RepID=A0A813ZTV8_9BILA|nr:unnamed protein product [Rotaria sordida]
MLVELSFMFIIILGRWLLPKGNISHSALSQLLLVYLSLASDILDLLTSLGETEIYLSSSMVRTVLIVFSLCMFQFTLNLTATRGRSFHAEFDDTQIEIRQSPERQLVSKPLSRRQQILDKLIPRTIFSPTTRPLATSQALHAKRRASSFSVFNPPDTIIENVDVNSDYEMKLNRNAIIPKPTFSEVDPPVNIPRQPMIHVSSIGSLNSLHSSMWNASRSKQASRKSIADSVKIFVRKRSAKFLRSEIWSILVTLSLQDGPFFAIRLIAIIVYHARSFLTYFFTFKNFLILIFQTYRIASICFEKDEQEQEFQEKVDKIRRMSVAASQLGIPLYRKI